LFNFQGPVSAAALADNLFIVSHPALFVKHFFEILFAALLGAPLPLFATAF
jgi:hypothetical protein